MEAGRGFERKGVVFRRFFDLLAVFANSAHLPVQGSELDCGTLQCRSYTAAICQTKQLEEVRVVISQAAAHGKAFLRLRPMAQPCAAVLDSAVALCPHNSPHLQYFLVAAELGLAVIAFVAIVPLL